ncbi:hypothetical protein BGW36DRAFT_457409 [Talaromyces proteolyticus]|uniref:Uncharacterized protein n=1 Tax=Talaromyces proteolyticus TaxID=1131652 RepID=A0AAD4KYM8_9EURO|nr:uncharacterized protein BGW36DRAFT_457409 [Talaromyces proteolyticus]KAH8703049.1 hypothetical protein BGW36DRAFT_457409 [Talaromyces proteolyticus]
MTAMNWRVEGFGVDVPHAYDSERGLRVQNRRGRISSSCMALLLLVCIFAATFFGAVVLLWTTGMNHNGRSAWIWASTVPDILARGT